MSKISLLLFPRRATFFPPRKGMVNGQSRAEDGVNAAVRPLEVAPHGSMHNSTRRLMRRSPDFQSEQRVARYGQTARQFLATAVLWPSQSMIRSAIWRLFLSIIIMWPLPLMPSPGRYMNFAVPPAPVMAATDPLQIFRRSSLLGPVDPSG